MRFRKAWSKSDPFEADALAAPTIVERIMFRRSARKMVAPSEQQHKDTTMSRTTTSGPAADLDALREDLSALKSDLASLARSVVDNGKKQAVAAKDQMKDAAQAGLESVEDAITNRPFTSVLVAFFGGVLAGAMLRRGT
jgi:ElaB/YqjD/DUF883 family membrane-anchored ribosome-binding protein